MVISILKVTGSNISRLERTDRAQSTGRVEIIAKRFTYEPDTITLMGMRG
jgi:hypothetical protein